MNTILKFALVAVFSLETIAGAPAQSKPYKPFVKSSTVHHATAHQRTSSVVLPDQSKKLNSDLAKLESQSSKTIRPARRAPEKSVVRPTKNFNQPERRNNSPINFTYHENKTGSAARNGGSRSSAAPIRSGPRMQ
jgi:hypothetical protein